MLSEWEGAKEGSEAGVIGAKTLGADVVGELVGTAVTGAKVGTDVAGEFVGTFVGCSDGLLEGIEVII